MKNHIYLIATFLICIYSLPLSAQQQLTAPRMPVDEKSGLMAYSKVVELTGVSEKVMYQRAMDWIYRYFKNPADVLREQDSVHHKIVCKARYKISNPPDKSGFSTDAGMVMYTLIFQFREGRYKYEITNINWKQTSYFPCERWIDEQAWKKNPEYVFYLSQVDEKSKEVIHDFDNALKTVPTAKSEDW